MPGATHGRPFVSAAGPASDMVLKIMTHLNTPVIFIIFNRPDVTEITFREIARARPRTLFVIADAPRPDRPDEAARCAAARAVIDRVTWECDVRTLFAEEHRGCRHQVPAGLDWAFSQVEEAIILEDDCLPDPSFFRFCTELLGHYRDDPRVMAVSGSCFLAPRDRPADSYYFGSIPLVWGWATWRRAWQTYDRRMAGWDAFRTSAEFMRMFPSLSTRWHYRGQMDRTWSGNVDTWDYQWVYSMWRQQGVALLPTRNLIRNLGLRADATHTRDHDPLLAPPLESIEFPLRHPPGPPAARLDLDRRWLDPRHRIPRRIARKVRWMLGMLGGRDTPAGT